MSKTKKTTEPHYELLYLVSNKLTEDEVKPIAEKIEQLITANGGAITYRENWGKKKLAYPIKHFNYGYYTLLEFDIEPITLAKIERSIRMTHDVLRHQIVVRQVRTIDMKEKPKVLFADEAKTPEKTEATVKTEKPVEQSPVSKAPEKEAEIKTETAETAEEKKPAIKRAKPTKETKASLEELDAKLDKILETNDLL